MVLQNLRGMDARSDQCSSHDADVLAQTCVVLVGNKQ